MYKQILRLALPNIITNITVPLLGMVDLAIVGHIGDTRYIGAIAIATMIFSMIYWLFGFLRMGTSGFTAQAYGADDMDESADILFRSLSVGLTAGARLFFFYINNPNPPPPCLVGAAVPNSKRLHDDTSTSIYGLPLPHY